MKTKVANGRNGVVEYRTRGQRRVVILEEAEYDRLRDKADEWEPPLPEPDANGNYPAVQYARVSLARKIIRHRRRLVLTRAELARRARIRPTTLALLEQGKRVPAIAAIERLEQALKAAEAERHPSRQGNRSRS